MAQSPLDGFTILVVDDEADVRVYLVTLLEDAGATVCEAADGAEALAVAKRRQPDLLTLDLAMPGTDGVAAFCELRRTPETADIPVCIVTGHPEYRQLIYERPERRPEGYMTKPIDEHRLLTNIRRILALHNR